MSFEIWRRVLWYKCMNVSSVPHVSIFKVEYVGSKFLWNGYAFLANYAESVCKNSLHIRRQENLWSRCLITLGTQFELVSS
jgi:hypothetical protein